MVLRIGQPEELATGLATIFPQMHWNCTLVDRLRHGLDSIPERDGPLTRYLRHAQGETSEREETRAIFESHINITSIPERSERSLVLLGFEPDDFAVPFPRKYIRHLTLKLKVAQANPRRSLLVNWLGRQTAAATDILYGLDRTIEWYVEQEIYPLRNSRKYACHRAGRSSWSPTILLRTNVRYDGFGPTEAAKRADVHVKLCRRCMHDEPGHARADTERMERVLTRLNFYSVVSGAGNTLYTGQFLRCRDAHLIFSELDRIAMTSDSGIAGITMESCVGFARSGASTGHRAAEVAPILTVHRAAH